MPEHNDTEAQRAMSEAVMRARRELKRIAKVVDKLSSVDRIDWGGVGDMNSIAFELERIADWEKKK